MLVVQNEIVMDLLVDFLESVKLGLALGNRSLQSAQYAFLGVLVKADLNALQSHKLVVHFLIVDVLNNVLD